MTLNASVESILETEYVDKNENVRCCPIQRKIWSLEAQAAR